MKESDYSEEMRGLALEGQVEVAEVFDQWYDSKYEYIKFLGDDERIYFIKRRKYGNARWRGSIHIFEVFDGKDKISTLGCHTGSS